jgi:hypothetical protein
VVVAGAGDGVVGGGESASEEVEFEVAVVLFGGGDGALSELAGDEDKAVSGGPWARWARMRLRPCVSRSSSEPSVR